MNKNVFEQLGQTLRDGIDMLNGYLAALRAAGSPQTLRADISAVAEVLKALGSTSDRLQKLMANDGFYMSEYEALEWWRALADEVVEAVTNGLSLTTLNMEEQRHIRNTIVDDIVERTEGMVQRQADWRASRRQNGYLSMEKNGNNRPRIEERDHEIS